MKNLAEVHADMARTMDGEHVKSSAKLMQLGSRVDGYEDWRPMVLSGIDSLQRRVEQDLDMLQQRLEQDVATLQNRVEQLEPSCVKVPCLF